jgi:hypothetical protein
MEAVAECQEVPNEEVAVEVIGLLKYRPWGVRTH